MALRPSKKPHQQQPYIRLSPAEEAEKEEENKEDIRYRIPKKAPPYTSIGFAVVLVLLGLLLVTGGFSLLLGYFETEEWRRGFVFVGVGILFLIPGIYVVSIALLTALGVNGYSYAMIPN